MHKLVKLNGKVSSTVVQKHLLCSKDSLNNIYNTPA